MLATQLIYARHERIAETAVARRLPIAITGYPSWCSPMS
jgi:hypothetical protein